MDLYTSKGCASPSVPPFAANNWNNSYEGKQKRKHIPCGLILNFHSLIYVVYISRKCSKCIKCIMFTKIYRWTKSTTHIYPTPTFAKCHHSTSDCYNPQNFSSLNCHPHTQLISIPTIVDFKIHSHSFWLVVLFCFFMACVFNHEQYVIFCKYVKFQARCSNIFFYH